jgi:hypothetical protein
MVSEIRGEDTGTQGAAPKRLAELGRGRSSEVLSIQDAKRKCNSSSQEGKEEIQRRTIRKHMKLRYVL